MITFSFFPPTTETDVAKKLGKKLKDVKELKKKGVLDYKGKLICNLSLNDYINGGYAYNDTLSINLQRKIDESVENHYKDMLLRKRVNSQLINLNKKSFLEITYKSTKMMIPTNFYAIKKVEWSNKAKIHSKNVFDTVKANLIDMIAYTHHQSNFDSRYDDRLKTYVSQMKEYGFVGMVNSFIDTHIQKLEIDEKKILESFERFNDDIKKSIKTISKLNKDLDMSKHYLSNGMMVTIYTKVKSECESELSLLKFDKNFDKYCTEAYKLDISNEINLWKRFKRLTNKRNGFGYSDFVTEFNNRDDCIDNHLLSKTDILSVVNETKSIFGQPKIDSFTLAIDEMRDKSDWNYNI